MIRISRSDKDRLEKANLLKHRDKRKNQDPNYYVANREHMGRDKTYYVVEEPKIMVFLGLKKPSNNRNKKPYNNNSEYKQNYSKKPKT